MNWIRAREKAKSIADADDPDCDISDLVSSGVTENIIQKCNTQDRPTILDPLVDLGRSDSSNLDGVLDLMCKSLHRAPCAIMALVPAAYENEPYLKNNPEITDFYKYHGGLLEAWDGPALLAFSDGKRIGVSLDRNGLRPVRYSIDKDGGVYVKHPYGEWIDRLRKDIKKSPVSADRLYDDETTTFAHHGINMHHDNEGYGWHGREHRGHSHQRCCIH